MLLQASFRHVGMQTVISKIVELKVVVSPSSLITSTSYIFANAALEYPLCSSEPAKRMSRGGRGGGGGRGASTSGVRAIASVLGIARHDIGAFTQVKKEAPKAYPVCFAVQRASKAPAVLAFIPTGHTT